MVCPSSIWTIVIIRSNPDMLPYLRLRMADVETRLTDTNPADIEWLPQLCEIAPEMP